MVWVKIDDGFYRNAKVMALSDGAYRAFVDALCYCADNLTDGLVERIVVERMGWKRRAGELVAAGFWDDDEGGYVVHNYLEYQMSRASVEEKREQARKRMESARGSRTVRANNERSSPNPDPIPDPVPVLSSPTDSPKQTRTKPQPIDAEFIAELVAEYAGTFDEARIRFELDKAENNKRVWDGWRDKRRGFSNWLKQAKEWQAERDRTARGGPSTAGNRSYGGGSRQGGLASRGAGAGEAQRTYEGPPRPSGSLLGSAGRPPGAAGSVASTGTS